MMLERILVPLVAALSFSSLGTAQIGWQPSLKTALYTAAEYDQAILIAVVMPGERGSDAVIPHYRDSRVVALSRECVCFRLDVGAGRASEDEREVLQRFLGAGPGDPIAVPHHLMVRPDGKTIISSASYQLTAGQLEWLMADGITKVNPDFECELSEGARAPDELRYDDVEKAEAEVKPPPTREETEAALAELKKGGVGWGGSLEKYTVVLRSDHPKAVKFIRAQLSGRGGRFLTGMALTAMGEISPVAYAPVLVDFLEDRQVANRETAARGLASMAHDKTNKAIRKRVKKEESAKVRGWLIRAAVATGPKDRATVTLVEKALGKKEDPAVRMQAAVAAGRLEDRDKAVALMSMALEDEDPTVRSAAAYAIAGRRDKELIGLLETSLEAEQDADTKHWIETARTVIAEEKDLKEFRQFRTKVLGETRWTGGRGRGGAGGGAGAGPGGGAGGGGAGPGTGGGGILVGTGL